MTIGVVALNLGGPSSLDDVEPFLYHLFSDPDVIQLGWASFLQKPLARWISRRRAPESRKAYAQIGGRSPIREESTAQAAAVVASLERRGVMARPFVAMGAWHPFSDEAVASLKEAGINRVVALPLFPHYSRTTTGSSFRQLDQAIARAGGGIDVARVDRYPDAPGFVEALCERIRAAVATLPENKRHDVQVLFSAHGLPESYIRRGDPYLDDVRITVAAVTEKMGLGARALLSFQSRVGPQKWLAPYTEAEIDRLAAAGTTALVVCPVAFTGEHIETLQELDILYRERAVAKGVAHFARAGAVGQHPAFIEALADATVTAARSRGWA